MYPPSLLLSEASPLCSCVPTRKRGRVSAHVAGECVHTSSSLSLSPPPSSLLPPPSHLQSPLPRSPRACQGGRITRSVRRIPFVRVCVWRTCALSACSSFFSFRLAHVKSPFPFFRHHLSPNPHTPPLALARRVCAHHPSWLLRIGAGCPPQLGDPPPLHPSASLPFFCHRPAALATRHVHAHLASRKQDTRGPPSLPVCELLARCEADSGPLFSKGVCVRVCVAATVLSVSFCLMCLCIVEYTACVVLCCVLCGVAPLPSSSFFWFPFSAGAEWTPPWCGATVLARAASWPNTCVREMRVRVGSGSCA